MGFSVTRTVTVKVLPGVSGSPVIEVATIAVGLPAAARARASVSHRATNTRRFTHPISILIGDLTSSSFQDSCAMRYESQSPPKSKDSFRGR